MFLLFLIQAVLYTKRRMYMKNGMREDLLLTKRDYLLYLGIRTDEKKKADAVLE